MGRYQETWRETASGVGRGWRPFSGQSCSWWSHCVCVEGGVKKSTQKQGNPEHRVPTVLGHRNTAGSRQQALEGTGARLWTGRTKGSRNFRKAAQQGTRRDGTGYKTTKLPK